MATPKDSRRITPETISFGQVARIAGWTDQPLSLIGFEHSVCSRRYPIGIAPSRRHAQLLCDSLNDRYANVPMMPRFGWLPENEIPAHKSVNFKTSIRQARSGKLRGEAATAIHSIAKEVEAVDETVAALELPDIVTCDGPQPGCFYVFVRLFPGLLASSPWKEWVVLSDGDIDSAMLSDARKWARENWNTVVAVVQKQSRMRMGTPPHRDDGELEAVERLLVEAQSRAKQNAINAMAATDPKVETSTPQAGTSADKFAYLDELVRIEEDTPPLNTKNRQWITASEAVAKGEAKSLDSLKSMRRQGRQNLDITFGVDKAGRKWRKEPGKQSIWYWVKTLSAANQVSKGNRHR